ncbi:ABC-type proline/glycine betaine transport system permease component [Rubrobacter radiotolerans]|uniref:ABC-type proline/glycine betaine transport system permease component n=1 Tax=Rubrobacter radiotolerans TaxID=42256 RepID=A0A023WYM4_RUBRA|nr:proline/glycine betaine ABC transporter permease [Rubrobacter radiotolerans]AHY45327.1 ABC-type proline/glycine betaine transport system permease component [Rubrobacter radiotolerans]MDX5892739.1 proline/glycine betaine ABC transporter permease [Rubrobacter radiotolerans]SMC02392.1 glycine betaine/proline transport system permease protein [Rubrobacter radiotolerans DSM 5868]
MLSQADFIPRIPLDDWIESFIDFVTTTFAGPFSVLQAIIGVFVNALETALAAPPALVTVAIFVALAYFVADWKVALLTAVGLLFMISLDLWDAAMLTLALVIASAVVALVISIPIGILAAQYRSVETAVRPVLDLMQTMPAFVYLIPAILLFGLGNVPGLIATVIFAMPPAVRLTLLGIQQVPKETVEAAHAFGATRWQTLLKVELPQALPTIMAGVNQVIMLALSMVVIAALIGAGGLGTAVVTGLTQLDVGTGFVGGIGIVIIAIILDRMTRNIGQNKRQSAAKG